MRKVKLKVQHWGKAPKHYGAHVYKFAPGIKDILIDNGFVCVKEAKEYFYFSIPPDQLLLRDKRKSKKEFIVTTLLPDDAEIERIAFAAHEKGESTRIKLGRWIAIYRAPRCEGGLVPVDLFTGTRTGKAKLSWSDPIFTIGVPLIWSVEITWYEDSEKPPQWIRHNDNIILDNPEVIQTILLFNASKPEDSQKADEPYPGFIAESLYEGSAEQKNVTIYERSHEARNQCIRHYGTKCKICNFDFSEVYGAIGTGFIHVHHLTPLSEIKSEYMIDPIQDLCPVCPNCHAMLHTRVPPYSIDELKAIMKSRTDKDYTA